MTLSDLQPSSIYLLVGGVGAFWLISFYLKITQSRLYWLTFWTLCAGLPALAMYWFATPWVTEKGNTFSFGQGVPLEWALGALTLVLWLFALALDFIVFIVTRIRARHRIEGRTGTQLDAE